ncbi:hypothetical protein C8R44DRAFT_931904 [Mycena epipterygia]|nr:hypothetical protein C8R44DRAFT_931904 [Mycena epipterygia]
MSNSRPCSMTSCILVMMPWLLTPKTEPTTVTLCSRATSGETDWSSSGHQRDLIATSNVAFPKFGPTLCIAEPAKEMVVDAVSLNIEETERWREESGCKEQPSIAVDWFKLRAECREEGEDSGRRGDRVRRYCPFGCKQDGTADCACAISEVDPAKARARKKYRWCQIDRIVLHIKAFKGRERPRSKLRKMTANVSVHFEVLPPGCRRCNGPDDNFGPRSPGSREDQLSKIMGFRVDVVSTLISCIGQNRKCEDLRQQLRGQAAHRRDHHPQPCKRVTFLLAHADKLVYFGCEAENIGLCHVNQALDLFRAEIRKEGCWGHCGLVAVWIRNNIL